MRKDIPFRCLRVHSARAMSRVSRGLGARLAFMLCMTAAAPARQRLFRGRHRHVGSARITGLVLALYLSVLPFHSASADDATEQQLRAALQQATSQIANLENQVANLQAQEAPSQALIASLQAQLQTLKQQAGQGGQASAASATAPAAATAKQDAELKRQLAAQQAALAKIQSDYSQAASAANTNAAANQQLTAQLAALKTANNSCLAKNAALFGTGNDILDQLAKRDTLWGSFSSAEPFIGIERVKLQTIVQDDRNKLLDNQIVPASPPVTGQ